MCEAEIVSQFGHKWLIRNCGGDSIAPESSEHLDQENMTETSPQAPLEKVSGLSGWLIVVGIGVVYSPIRIVATNHPT